MCAEYLALIKSLFDSRIGRFAQSERQRPLGRVDVLGLHRAEPAHYIHRVLKPC